MFYFIILTMLVLAALAIVLFTNGVERSLALVPVVAAVCWTGWNMVYQVPVGNVGLVYAFGNIVNQTGEGLQFVAPWQAVWPASVQVQSVKYHGKDHLSSFSQETQDVFVDATANIRVDSKDIQSLYRNVGADYINILVSPRVRQAFKDETVKFRSVDIAPHREEIRKAVGDRLRHELGIRSIVVEDLLLDNISFLPEFQKSIENKQIATQNALAEEQNIVAAKNRAQQVVETARGTAQRTLIEATAQAQANEKLAASITPQLVQYQMVTKLAPNVSTIMMPTSQPFIMDKSLFTTPK